VVEPIYAVTPLLDSVAILVLRAFRALADGSPILSGRHTYREPPTYAAKVRECSIFLALEWCH
jgi:hypothetical protein